MPRYDVHVTACFEVVANNEDAAIEEAMMRSIGGELDDSNFHVDLIEDDPKPKKKRKKAHGKESR
jgi:hypothetical protein